MNEAEALDSPAPEVPGPGRLLREAREARGMSVADVSAALKLSPRQIEAIETEDFARLSGATFIRGFVRNYAKLLRIDAAPLLAALEDRSELRQVELTAPGGSGVRMPSGADGRGKGALVGTFVALALLIAALALYFNAVDLGGMLAPRAEAPPQAPGPAGPGVQVAQPAAAIVPTPAAEAGAPGAPVPVQAEAPMPGPGERRLVFSFDADSWVEVKDASGRVAIYQLNPKGSTRVVDGRPPFQVVVGNASQVRLHYDDKPVDLVPHTRVDVARMTLE